MSLSATIASAYCTYVAHLRGLIRSHSGLPTYLADIVAKHVEPTREAHFGMVIASGAHISAEIKTSRRGINHCSVYVAIRHASAPRLANRACSIIVHNARCDPFIMNTTATTCDDEYWGQCIAESINRLLANICDRLGWPRFEGIDPVEIPDVLSQLAGKYAEATNRLIQYGHL